MAEEISDNQFKNEMLDFKNDMLDFKTEVMRFVKVEDHKFDGLIADVRSNSIRLDKLEQRIGQLQLDHGEKFDAIATMVRNLSIEVKTLSGQFKDVGSMSIADHKRLDILEERVDVLEAEVH